MKNQFTQFWSEKRLINLFLLIVIFWMSIWFLRFSKTFPYGDGIEYILMTEAIYSHGSPDIQQKDIEQYTNYLNSRNITIDKKDVFTTVSDYIDAFKENDLKYTKGSIKDLGGYAIGKKGRIYSIHFWFYSSLAIPARAVLHILDANITKTFLLTNLSLFFIAISLLLKEKSLPMWKRFTLAFALGFSSSTWYMAWPHPELFAGVWMFMGVFYFFINRKFLALFIISLVSMHFPPMAFLSFFILLNILYEKRKQWAVPLFIKLFFVSIWVFLPIVYNLIAFGTPNVIMELGYLSWDLVSVHRFISFILDPNQGLILAIPIILLLFLVFIVTDVIKRKVWVGYYLLSSIILMSLFFMQMKNWNHGGTVVNRYVVWVASIITIVLIFRLFQIKKKMILIPLLILTLATQAVVITQQAHFKKLNWSSTYFSPFGEYILSNYPQYYNPEPHIFSVRVNKLSVSTTDSVVVYSNAEGVITKMMVDTSSYRQLITRGMDSIKVEEFKKIAKKYNGNWFYVNNTDFKRLNYQQSKDTLIKSIDRKNKTVLYKQIKNEIYNDKTWYNNLVAIAKEKKLPIEKIIDEEVKTFMYKKLNN